SPDCSGKVLGLVFVRCPIMKLHRYIYYDWQMTPIDFQTLQSLTPALDRDECGAAMEIQSQLHPAWSLREVTEKLHFSVLQLVK
ncbi:hypothetical protein DPMN_181198, partial [Dreissena polymorpha]